MRILLSFLIISSLTKLSFGLKCQGCEITETGEVCDFSYKCPKSTEYCETLVSKVNGSYSVVLACASKEKCQAEFIEDGLSKCKHSKVDTECYTCCEGDDCNTLDLALADLPDDIFEPPKKADKKKSNKSKNDVDEDEEEAEEEEEEEAAVEAEEKEKPAKKKNKKANKGKIEEDDEEVAEEEEEKEESEDTEESEMIKKPNAPKDKNEARVLTDDDAGNANETVLENAEVNKGNVAIIGLNKTENGTLEGVENNNDQEQVPPPIDVDPNIQAIDKKLNETGIIVKEIDDGNLNMDHGNAGDQGAPKNLTENEANEAFNATGTVEIKTEDGIVIETEGEQFEEPEVENAGETESNPEGEPAEPGDFSEFNQSTSCNLEISSILLAISFLIISINLF